MLIVFLFFLWLVVKVIVWFFYLVCLFGNGLCFVGLDNYLCIFIDDGFYVFLCVMLVFMVGSILLVVIFVLGLVVCLELDVCVKCLLCSIFIWFYVVVGVVVGIVLKVLINLVIGLLVFFNYFWLGLWVFYLVG